MKTIVTFFLIFVLVSCSATKFVDTWRNKEVTQFEPKKVLIVGMTDNVTARKIFEDEMTRAFQIRNINAVPSTNFLNPPYIDEKKSEAEIDAILEKLIKNEFDAILITAIKGIDEKVSYSTGYYYPFASPWPYFHNYYYYYQNYYFTPSFYEDYKVYHVETSIYNINKEVNKSLVWVGTLDIVNPKSISSSVKNYVKSTIDQLEHENLIPKR